MEKMEINLMNHNESVKIGDFSVEFIVIRREIPTSKLVQY